MPESNKAAKKRQQKANRAAGIGDESGRIVRVKEAAKMARCNICEAELKITKTNTELKAHAEGKHGKTCEEVFPGADAIAAEMAAKVKGGAAAAAPKSGGKKKKDIGNLDDLFADALKVGPTKGGKGKK
mmetsp:Transcript_13454/g.27459  ORF Transcript_13454/g.27459 Transcript_13454/m.27459 type:complete len:129 (-) Transcript_13454:153-539(-)|eukprot:CAMPEP_0118645048 /NCGR_PEP_ID=MMETSP0785-20121206/7285_1 /TAXON_ID=91992 /ORGANISM="Bolidomonas pacifica, Strain CCMP 1866" /LENGTH=128 /DNA_ID=CAMNT_0006536889 /DNA_START=142 /DNA_END=528 /DNA_ORIENTATION=-